MTDAERLARNVAKLGRARHHLEAVLDDTTMERRDCKDRGDFANYEVLARCAAHIHSALSGLELACAESFNLETDEVKPRTGGGGK